MGALRAACCVAARLGCTSRPSPGQDIAVEYAPVAPNALAAWLASLERMYRESLKSYVKRVGARGGQHAVP